MSEKDAWLKVCGGKYGVVPDWVTSSRRLSQGAFRLYDAFCKNVNKAGQCFRSNTKLGKQLGVTKRTIQRWRRELEQEGLLVVRKSSDKGNFYKVVRHPVEADEARLSNDSKIAKRKKFEAYGRVGAAKRHATKNDSIDDGKQPVGGDRIVTGGGDRIVTHNRTYRTRPYSC
jgi:DNA-binding transcriptional regulator YhcF (GntR family)